MIPDDDEIRGDRQNPVVALELELFKTLRRYEDVVEARPQYVAAILVEYADALRVMHDLDHEVNHHGEDVFTARFGGPSGDMVGWIGAPRSGEYLDIDIETLDELLEKDVDDLGLSFEQIDLARDDEEGSP